MHIEFSPLLLPPSGVYHCPSAITTLSLPITKTATKTSWKCQWGSHPCSAGEDYVVVFHIFPLVFTHMNTSWHVSHLVNCRETRIPTNTWRRVHCRPQSFCTMALCAFSPLVRFLLAPWKTYSMAYYYAFNLTYPKCIATLLSVIQTEVLSDEIHESDATRVYKKTMTEWKEFTTK